jgi:hypothetical protein
VTQLAKMHYSVPNLYLGQWSTDKWYVKKFCPSNTPVGANKLTAFSSLAAMHPLINGAQRDSSIHKLYMLIPLCEKVYLQKVSVFS